MVAETSCRYFRELGFPDPIEMGLVVDKVGTSSVIYRIGLFQGDSDEAAAEGRFVHVYVDNTDPARPVTPMPDVDPRGRRAAPAPALTTRTSAARTCVTSATRPGPARAGDSEGRARCATLERRVRPFPIPTLRRKPPCSSSPSRCS